MKRIDFQHFRMPYGIKGDNMVEVDAREQFANLIYQNANGIAALTLAQKIYKSEGETEYDEREEALMTQVVEQLTTPQFIEGYRNIMDEQKQ